jgi:hypothetical protein
MSDTESFPLIEILQHYGQSGRTGRFDVRGRESKGMISLMSGFVAYAEVGAIQGEYAVYEILSWDNPHYEWVEGDTPAETIMSGTVQDMVVKAIEAKSSGELDRIRSESRFYDKTRPINGISDYLITLSVFGGEVESFEYEVASKQLRIGRQPDNDLVLSDSSVSRKHALLIVNKNSVLVRDLGSMNGVKIDGQPLAQGIARDGQIISIGEISCKLNFSPLPDPSSSPRMAPHQK